MIKPLHTKRFGKLTILLFIVLFSSCKKDKVIPCPVQEPTKYELISGDYKVYDTLGNFMYEMNLNFIDGPVIAGVKSDTVLFTNFDGQFEFAQHQGFNSSNPEYFIQIGIQDTVYDDNGNKWKILFDTDPIYNNILQNDTIRMIFHKTNINYWVEDAVPYYECYCKQIAVKKH